MSKHLPVPVRSERPERLERPRRVERPEVIVIDPGRLAERRQPHPLARLALALVPDLLRAAERSLAQRQPPPALVRLEQKEPREPRARASGFQLSEVEYDMRVPFVRRVTVRRASAWSAELPQLLSSDAAPEPHGKSGLRRAGVVGAGALALAALGLLAGRSGSLPGLGGRR